MIRSLPRLFGFGAFALIVLSAPAVEAQPAPGDVGWTCTYWRESASSGSAARNRECAQWSRGPNAAGSIPPPPFMAQQAAQKPHQPQKATGAKKNQHSR